MQIIYSFNKTGFEADCWEKEIRSASANGFNFIPFNHGNYLDPSFYAVAEKLDQCYQGRDAKLLNMYAALQALINKEKAQAMIVANAPPYHPDFLRKLNIYKALYSADDPGATYLINIPYLHAYDHVFYVDPVYSPDMDMQEKMRYCGMKNADWLPISAFDFEFEPSKDEGRLFSQERDIDVIYVGKFWRQKMDTLVKVKKAMGSKFKMYGLFRWKHNLYLNIIHQYGGWVKPISHQDRVKLYQRSKIGFNIHWNEYGLGNQRLYHLPANGVMQISDCADHLGRIFKPDQEIAAYRNADELIDKIKYYLKNDAERQAIAKAGYQRVMKDYRFAQVTQRAASLIQKGMQ